MCLRGGTMVLDKSELKRPIGIYILALLFMVAPLGNIFLSLAGSGVDQWYEFDILKQLLLSIPFADWLWLGGVFIAGCTLLMRHKSAWMLAVLVLGLVLVMNTYRAFTLDDSILNPEFVRMQILVSILVTFSVLIIAFYARYPYLDRRQQWMFPTAHRYNIATSVIVHIGEGVSGVTESVSTSGVRIQLSKSVEGIKELQDLEITFTELEKFKVKSEVVEFSGTTLRLKFKQFGWGARGHLEAWLKSKTV